MNMEINQSPEADLDREIEELLGRKIRGTFTDADSERLASLQSRRARLMRPHAPLRKHTGFVRHFA
jgi:hypothetical protein